MSRAIRRNFSATVSDSDSECLRSSTRLHRSAQARTSLASSGVTSSPSAHRIRGGTGDVERAAAILGALVHRLHRLKRQRHPHRRHLLPLVILAFPDQLRHARLYITPARPSSCRRRGVNRAVEGALASSEKLNGVLSREL